MGTDLLLGGQEDGWHMAMQSRGVQVKPSFKMKYSGLRKVLFDGRFYESFSRDLVLKHCKKFEKFTRST